MSSRGMGSARSDGGGRFSTIAALFPPTFIISPLIFKKSFSNSSRLAFDDVSRQNPLLPYYTLITWSFTRSLPRTCQSPYLKRPALLG